MSPEDFERIKRASCTLTKEEREAQKVALKAEREAIIVRHDFSFCCKEDLNVFHASLYL